MNEKQIESNQQGSSEGTDVLVDLAAKYGNDQIESDTRRVEESFYSFAEWVRNASLQLRTRAELEAVLRQGLGAKGLPVGEINYYPFDTSSPSTHAEERLRDSEHRSRMQGVVAQGALSFAGTEGSPFIGGSRGFLKQKPQGEGSQQSGRTGQMFDLDLYVNPGDLKKLSPQTEISVEHTAGDTIKSVE